MKLPEIFMVHALARLARDANEIGDHPLNPYQYQEFYNQVTADELLREGPHLNLFNRFGEFIDNERLRRSADMRKSYLL